MMITKEKIFAAPAYPLFLGVLFIFAYLLKREYWKDVK